MKLILLNVNKFQVFPLQSNSEEIEWFKISQTAVFNFSDVLKYTVNL